MENQENKINAEKKKNAEKIYKLVLEVVQSYKCRFEQNDEKMMVQYTSRGEDIPIDIIIHVDEERSLIRSFSFLPFKFSEEKRLEGAIATNAINYILQDGYFEYDYETGIVDFKVSTSYDGSIISKTIIEHVLSYSEYAVDRFNDLLLSLSKSYITMDEFRKRLEKE